MKKIIIGISLILIIILSLIIKSKEEKKVSISYKETNNMLSYTIDGKETKEKPSKEGNYIVKKIECEKNTNIVWDNTNWQVEIKNIESEDICNIDFTTNTSAEGYRVTINSNNNSSLDSLSKSTIRGGSIEFESINEIKSVSGCNGKIVDGRLVIENVISNQTCIVNVAERFYNKLLSDNPTHTGQRPNAFNGVYTADNTGVMYVANGNQTEDGSNVYYFAGNALNNWVKFGKNEQNEDLYWRIIRTNEDGSVRMLYSGTSPNTTTGYIKSNLVYNNSDRDPIFVGYMYGTSGSLANNRTNENSSNIKTIIDEWYNRGLNTKADTSGNKYDFYISQTAIYCNDRANQNYNTSADFYYAANYRLISGKSPSYKCGNNASGSLYTGINGADVADKFSKSTSKGGNGNLIYPIALMTADEISFAGGLYNTNAPVWYYYNNGTDSIVGKRNMWWTMTPAYRVGCTSSMCQIYTNVLEVQVDTSNSIKGFLSNNGRVTGGADHVIRPVLSLKSCATWKSGNGAWNIPYEVSIDSACASAVN